MRRTTGKEVIKLFEDVQCTLVQLKTTAFRNVNFHLFTSLKTEGNSISYC